MLQWNLPSRTQDLQTNRVPREAQILRFLQASHYTEEQGCGQVDGGKRKAATARCTANPIMTEPGKGKELAGESGRPDSRM